MSLDTTTKLQRINQFIETLNEASQEKLLYIFQDRPREDSEMGDERTLKELGAPKLDDEPLCIVFPTLERPLKLNSGFLNLLPKFYGNAGEDPHRHLKEFIVVCSTMKPEGIEQNQVRLHAFPISLHDLAKDWLYTMSSGSITTWDALQKAFLEKFFPASRIGSIRKEICGIRQHNSESLYEYWERFKKLCASCPQHQITDQLLIQYFYEGLLPNDRGMIDAASGGALVDKTPTQARNLIANMAQNTQQHSTRNDVKRVNEIDFSGVKSQLQENAQQIATLTTLVSKIVIGNESKARVCGLCSEFSHATDACPTLKTEDVNALGGSAVNIMPASFYDECKMGPLKTSNGVLTMADGSNVNTIGLLDNVLIQIRHMFFLVDFVVLDTKHESEILLGRPFLKTARALIDVANEYVILESNGERMQLNIFEEHNFNIEANATDYATYCLAQVGEANLEILLDQMASTLGLGQLFHTTLNESSLHE
ncbi:hypothetical protein BVRB_8g188390 [Beta vulgaris subsp. vulgaris]|nr:hypothetical protein BVRB_8g188390 [Beta vulgaris subsp. vulgaris]